MSIKNMHAAYTHAMSISLGILFFSISSCTDRKIKHEPIPEIEVPTSNTRISQQFDSLFSYSHHLILQTTDSSMIGIINKVLIEDDLLYVMSDQAKITVFSSNGDYVRSFSHIGQGPGEYASLSDFDVRDSIVYLLAGNSIHKYSTSNVYTGSVSLRNSALGLAVLRNGIALNNGFGTGNSNTKEHFCYSFIPNDGEVYNDVEFNDELLGHVYIVNGQASSFVRNGESIMTMFPYNETLYDVDIESGRLSPRVEIVMKGRNLTPDSTPEEVKETLASDLPALFYALHSCNENLMFSYICKGKGPSTALVSSRDVIMNGPIGIDSNSLPVSLFTLNSTKQTEEILSIVPSEVIANIAEKKDDPSQYPVLVDIAANLTEDSNPVLVFYHPKNVTE
ncbi:MAG: 6-bladed beta-propeller [Muribaculaceae bacterium]|nr:6-bladed beta-propeller [Muribaculaceae bacterium]